VLLLDDESVVGMDTSQNSQPITSNKEMTAENLSSLETGKET